ncbi:MAG TPA: hypothetical protein VF068_00805 [Rubrobacter sp.]
MTDPLPERMGAACGILYVVLLVAGPSIGGPTSRVAFSLEILAFLFFLFFLGSLWSALRRAEEGSGWLSTTAFGAGLMSVTIKVTSAAPVLAARYRSGGLDPQLARTLQEINNASFFLTFFPLAVLLGVFAILAIRSGALPGWLGWIAAVLAVAFLAGGLVGSANLASEWAGLPMILFTVWVVATSVVLIRRAGEARPVETATGRAAPVG